MSRTALPSLVAMALAACSSPSELSFRSYSRYGEAGPVQRDAFIELDGDNLTSLDRDELGRNRIRFATLTPAGAAELDAAVTAIESSWDPSLACPACRTYQAYAFLDGDGTTLSTSHAAGAVPESYRALVDFSEGVFATLSECQMSPLYIMTSASCPPPQ